MIVILKYSIKTDQEFSEIFEKLKLDYTFTLDESIIIKASHIILPNTYNLKTAIRKMQLKNLYSVLRMIKKPILGINNGLNLMCNNLTDIQKLGLGFFPIDSNTCIINDDVRLRKNNYAEIERKEKKNSVGRIKILQNTDLLNQINTKTVNYHLEQSTDVNDFTTSKISNNNQEFSLTCENENYYSIQMEISKNKNLFGKLIENFVKL